MATDPLSGTQKDQEKTKPNYPFAAKPKPDAFDRLEENVEVLWQNDSELGRDWLNLSLIDEAGLPESPFDTVKWLDEEPEPVKKMTNEEDNLPDWMKEHDPDKDGQSIGFSEFRWKPVAGAKKDEKKFDPNKTQKVKAVKTDEPHETQGDQLQPKKAPEKTKVSFINLDKFDKAFIAFVGLFLYAIAVNLAGSFIPARFDEIVLNLTGYYLYMYFADKGYDIKNLLPRK